MNDLQLDRSFKVNLILIGFLIPLFLPLQLSAQINIKTGYSLSYFNPEVNNSILSTFNESNKEWLDNNFKEIHWMHGMHLGVRYKIEDLVGIELGWVNKFSKSDAEGIEPTSEEDYYRKLNYRHNQFSFGLESILGGRVGWGGTIDYNLISIKSKHESSGSKFNALKGNNWSSNFFITYYTDSSNGISFALRPYVRVPWTTINYHSLEDDLNDTDTSGEKLDKALHYGITLLFFNGN